jgi:formate hydrogenlyase subunit 4
MQAASYVVPASGLLLAPLLFGLINRTKAWFAGRRGQPLLQAYFDLAKLLRKGAVYSRTTSWIFRAGPIVGLASALAALALLPVAGVGSPLAFGGDVVLFAYLWALARFFTVLAALDTGSAFEGMGASREVQFSALAEPALFLALATLARLTGDLSLSGIFAGVTPAAWAAQGSSLALVAVALFVVALAENARIPVDDPTTHLELTMIHEVMVLDHGGPDLAFVEYGAALKLWILGALVVGVAVPVRTGDPVVDGAAFLAGMAALAVAIGVVESTMARQKLLRVPHLLLAAGAMSALALVFLVR